MRRFWLFPGFALLAVGCPSDDTTATATDTETDTGSTDEDDDSESDNASAESPTSDPDTSSDGGSSDTAPDTGTDSSTTMAGPICGDGTMDEGEECDDENVDNGDGCSAECTIPFEIVWTATHNGGASNQDDANEVIVGADGNIYVIGSERNTNTGLDLWLQQYLPDGTEGWTFTFDGGDSLDDGGSAIAFDANGNLVMTGRTESAANVDDILVLSLDIANQTLIGDPIIIDGPGSGMDDIDDEDRGSDIAVGPDGLLAVTGRVRVDGESFNVWVAEIDPALQPNPVVWEQTLNGPDSGPDFGVAVHVAGDGTVYVLANQEDTNITSGVVLVFGDDGTPQAADTISLPYFANDFEFDAAGNVVIIGSEEPGNSGADHRTALYDDAFAEQWVAYHDGPAHTDDFPAGVAIDAEGRVVTVGSHATLNQSADAWVGTYQADGAPWWGDAHTSKSELDDFFNDVAVMPDGNFVVVGSETVLGQQRNAFVRVYHSL